MNGPGFFISKTGQTSLYLLALAALTSGFWGLQGLGNYKLAEKEAIERCDSCLEREEIALGKAKSRQRLSVCPPPPPPPSPKPEPARKAVRSEKLPASRSGRSSGVVQGMASWYGAGDGLSGARTASGERLDPAAYTAAHRTLPFGTRVKVTCLKTGKSAVVRINDRGPFSNNRIIDISHAAAVKIGLKSSGVGKVSLEVLK